MQRSKKKKKNMAMKRCRKETVKTSRKTFHRFQSTVNPGVHERGRKTPRSINHFPTMNSTKSSFLRGTWTVSLPGLIGCRGGRRYQFRQRVHKTAGFQASISGGWLFARHHRAAVSPFLATSPTNIIDHGRCPRPLTAAWNRNGPCI